MVTSDFRPTVDMGQVLHIEKCENVQYNPNLLQNPQNSCVI